MDLVRGQGKTWYKALKWTMNSAGNFSVTHTISIDSFQRKKKSHIEFAFIYIFFVLQLLYFIFAIYVFVFVSFTIEFLLSAKYSFVTCLCLCELCSCVCVCVCVEKGFKITYTTDINLYTLWVSYSTLRRWVRFFL